MLNLCWRAPIDGAVIRCVRVQHQTRMMSDAVRHCFDEHRPRALDAQGARSPHRHVRAEHVVAVHADRCHPEAARCTA